MSRIRLSRRQLGSAVAGGLVFSTVADAQEAKAKTPSPADALLEIVKLRYAKQLDEAKLKAIRQSLQSGLVTAERLRKLKVADEPAFSFSADLP